jgi:hypothetical protein
VTTRRVLAYLVPEYGKGAKIAASGAGSSRKT